ncbi:hypothetical protein VSS37_07790 [Candidatus Thiothrix sp. Deng01]|uniref:Uncharacterized protein n=1 Tax=Candidatus Thiothrix phosphatis TaxID=3112415 RepID=A0ABU6CVM3_9GAMM|nr:hypothetical protein [Candidatus Thiothrix sp. Deng01]MEB4590874.1 hypothetical protein [Candidatus Thiothrix sp. Deng01]
MSKWVVSRVIDILIAFTLATLLLWFGAISHPEFFPESFFQYWGSTMPASVTATKTVLVK